MDQLCLWMTSYRQTLPLTHWDKAKGDPSPQSAPGFEVSMILWPDHNHHHPHRRHTDLKTLLPHRLTL